MLPPSLGPVAIPDRRRRRDWPRLRNAAVYRAPPVPKTIAPVVVVVEVVIVVVVVVAVVVVAVVLVVVVVVVVVAGEVVVGEGVLTASAKP